MSSEMSGEISSLQNCANMKARKARRKTSIYLKNI